MRHESLDLTHEGLEPNVAIVDVPAGRDVSPAELDRLGRALIMDAPRVASPNGSPVPAKKRISVAERVSSHRMILVRRSTGRPVTQFNATKSPSWLTKPKNRAKAKAARRARKANR